MKSLWSRKTGKQAAELAVALLCQGVRLDSSCFQEGEVRPIFKRRAGLGSGLELVIPSNEKNFWINVPVKEKFVAQSPYHIVKENDKYLVVNQEKELSWPLLFPPAPLWYTQKTTQGTLMSRVGVLQGTYLGIYVGKRCSFWRDTPSQACHFCTTGIQIGVHEESQKSVSDVVETALQAKKESGVTFVHLNSGYQQEQDLELIVPFVKALKEEVGILVGVQCIPPSQVEAYQPLLKLGVDHFSICYEFHNPSYFSQYLPGKSQQIGQQRFFQALEYLSNRMPRGSVSGEIIAGVEPTTSTLEAIDYITSLGAFPTVCIFRPLQGAVLQDSPPPKKEEMIKIFRHVALKCIEKKIPIGMVPNLEVSLVMTPEDTRYLLPRDFSWQLYHLQQRAKKIAAMPYFAWKKRRQT